MGKKINKCYFIKIQTYYKVKKPKNPSGTSLVQGLRSAFPTQGAWVRPLVRELVPTCCKQQFLCCNGDPAQPDKHTHTPQTQKRKNKNR